MKSPSHTGANNSHGDGADSSFAWISPMRVALISYEYPPDTAFGGIGTYVHQAAALLARRGHSVEVFSASDRRSGHFIAGNVGVNLVGEMRREKFAAAVEPIFSKRHAIRNFDVVESPEYFGDGREILERHPEIPHVVKLHTPNELIRRIGSCSTRLGWVRHNLSQARIMAGALRKGRRPQRYQSYQTPGQDEVDLMERHYVSDCTFVVSPSKAMADWAVREWGIDANRTMVVPNPYIPSKDLLSVPSVSNRNVVGFFGRLEYRKGICDLVAAIPLILRANPDVSFRFVGKALQHPGTLESFEAFIWRKLRNVRRNITITGSVKLEEMPLEYSKVDVCVFPSIWENFPNVCLEAMSAARGIVASHAGGMAEMLEANCGFLVPPRNPAALADATIRLLGAEQLRIQMGSNCRSRVLERYSEESIGPIIERSYAKAIELTLANACRASSCGSQKSSLAS
jgi:glycogen synthase